MRKGRYRLPEDTQLYYVRVSKTIKMGENKERRCFFRIAAVVVGYAGKVPCRGVSICSNTDTFNRREAVKKAVARYRRAVGTGQSGEEIKKVHIVSRGHSRTENPIAHNIDFLRCTGWCITDKVGYAVTLTYAEIHILKKAAEARIDKIK